MTILADQTTAYEPTPADWLEYGQWCDDQDRQWLASLNTDWHAIEEPTPLEVLERIAPDTDEIDPDSEVRIGLNSAADLATVRLALSERQARQGRINRRDRRITAGLLWGPLSEREARPRLDYLRADHYRRRSVWVARQKALIAGGAR